ncbi:unnamed protein product [Closterium sp. Naga37s-1]|nr:unnamed protein product [Closterium sp. Naga37s-1]
MEERRKFQEETVVNVGGGMARRRRGARTVQQEGSATEYIVVSVASLPSGIYAFRASRLFSCTVQQEGSSTEYIVVSGVGGSVGWAVLYVTITAACEGTLNLPEVKSAASLKEALARLGSIPIDELQGVEVLWTPQDPSDSLTAHDILSDYPSMRML